MLPAVDGCRRPSCFSQAQPSTLQDQCTPAFRAPQINTPHNNTAARPLHYPPPRPHLQMLQQLMQREPRQPLFDPVGSCDVGAGGEVAGFGFHFDAECGPHAPLVREEVCRVQALRLGGGGGARGVSGRQRQGDARGGSLCDDALR